jgi:hypothetical protein
MGKRGLTRRLKAAAAATPTIITSSYATGTLNFYYLPILNPEYLYLIGVVHAAIRYFILRWLRISKTSIRLPT